MIALEAAAREMAIPDPSCSCSWSEQVCGSRFRAHASMPLCRRSRRLPDRDEALKRFPGARVLKITRLGSQPSSRGSADNFTGHARRDPLFTTPAPSRLVGGSVTFDAGARTAWHTHPVGQILIATEGKGYVQKKGEAIKLLLPGDVVTVLPGEEHWHGATPDSIFTHIAINLVSINGEEVAWLSPVTDAEYSAPLQGR